MWNKMNHLIHSNVNSSRESKPIPSIECIHRMNRKFAKCFDNFIPRSISNSYHVLPPTQMRQPSLLDPWVGTYMRHGEPISKSPHGRRNGMSTTTATKPRALGITINSIEATMIPGCLAVNAALMWLWNSVFYFRQEIFHTCVAECENPIDDHDVACSSTTWRWASNFRFDGKVQHPGLRRTRVVLGINVCFRLQSKNHNLLHCWTYEPCMNTLFPCLHVWALRET